CFDDDGAFFIRDPEGKGLRWLLLDQARQATIALLLAKIQSSIQCNHGPSTLTRFLLEMRHKSTTQAMQHPSVATRDFTTVATEQVSITQLALSLTWNTFINAAIGSFEVLFLLFVDCLVLLVAIVVAANVANASLAACILSKLAKVSLASIALPFYLWAFDRSS
ncbi:hypothetical protein CLAIMM_05139, partial [Cladophialophora immunda]